MTINDIGLNEVHVGQAIAKRIKELEITRTEFGSRIGVQQQHVKRILERDTMETKKLVAVCRALEFNFFKLFCNNGSTNVSAYQSAVTMGSGNAQNYIGGEAALLAELEKYKERTAHLEESKAELKDQIATLKAPIEQMKTQLQAKEEIIKLVRNQQ